MLESLVRKKRVELSCAAQSATVTKRGSVLAGMRNVGGFGRFAVEMSSTHSSTSC